MQKVRLVLPRNARRRKPNEIGGCESEATKILRQTYEKTIRCDLSTMRQKSSALRIAKRPPSTWLLVGVDAVEGVPSAWNLPEMLSLAKVEAPLLSVFSRAVSGAEVPVS